MRSKESRRPVIDEVFKARPDWAGLPNVPKPPPTVCGANKPPPVEEKNRKLTSKLQREQKQLCTHLKHYIHSVIDSWDSVVLVVVDRSLAELEVLLGHQAALIPAVQD